MLSNNTANERRCKRAPEERSQVSSWLIPKENPLEECSVLLFTKLLSIHHLTWSSYKRRKMLTLNVLFLTEEVAAQEGWLAQGHSQSSGALGLPMSAPPWCCLFQKRQRSDTDGAWCEASPWRQETSLDLKNCAWLRRRESMQWLRETEQNNKDGKEQDVVVGWWDWSDWNRLCGQRSSRREGQRDKTQGSNECQAKEIALGSLSQWEQMNNSEETGMIKTVLGERT